MQATRAIPGQAFTVDCDPTGWPFTVTVGGVEVTAWPEKYRGSRRAVKARLHFKIPELGTGAHQIIVRDRNGPTLAGIVNI